MKRDFRYDFKTIFNQFLFSYKLVSILLFLLGKKTNK